MRLKINYHPTAKRRWDKIRIPMLVVFIQSLILSKTGASVFLRLKLISIFIRNFFFFFLQMIYDDPKTVASTVNIKAYQQII